MPSETPDRYDIREEVGRGGMSVVYRARDEVLERDVALKVLHDHVASKSKNRERFRREARAVARLDHDNIVEIFDYSEESENASYIVMEYLDGSNLADFAAQHPPLLSEITALIGIELCDALEHAHHKGVIHRDLKPGNIMLTSDGHLKLTDFGIAHVVDAETMTQTGSLLGSPAHMAPELIEASAVDERSDIYSLGTILYFLCTGELPFRGDNPSQLLKNILDCDVEPPDRRDNRVAPDISQVIVDCLHRNPDERIGTMTELRERLWESLDTCDVDPNQTVPDYFRAPEQTTGELLADIIPLLTEKGEAALDHGNYAEAMSHFNRVLAFEPEHEEVNRKLERLHSDKRQKDRQRRSMIAVFSLAVLGILVATGFWYQGVRETRTAFAQTQQQIRGGFDRAVTNLTVKRAARLISSGQTAGAQRVASHSGHRLAESTTGRVDTIVQILRYRRTQLKDAQPDEVNSPDPALSDKPTETPSKSSSTDAKETEATTSEPAETLTYKFKVRPPAAQLYIDGQRIPFWRAQQGLELKKGRHKLVAESKGCKRLEKTLLVREPRDDEIPVILEWKEAKINVVSNREALVWINGSERRYIEPGGNNANIDISFGDATSLETKRKIELAVAPRDNLQNRQTQTLRLKPGSETTVHMQF